ncbi:MAG TPA: phosphoenolpyruvate mutase [Xanthomonadales bacterium]|nr:phosphoenolpyruvate mutase [Xanthomonadales bacterium]
MNRKTAQLSNLLKSDTTEFILEAHNGLSARIAEEAGFKGIWASGLAMSAQHAVRDNNELSWTQVVDTLEFMSDATSIPILLDGDTGYGDFNNMRRLVAKLEQRDIAGVCIEDKLFPKTNSFIQGERQPLEDIDMFCGKIKAGKDAQMHEDFCIIARVEALIAGWGLDEAIRRGEAYREAGADAVLIHSKLSRPDEILQFAREWADRCPLVIVPTKFYSTPTDVFRQHRISLVIWANHLIRSSIAAMQNTALQIHAAESLVDVEGQVATVQEIFRLQGADELLEAEKRYARSVGQETNAIILAASRGMGLDELTRDRPKVMIPVAGKPVLRRLVDKFKGQGINDITVVAGYRAEAIDVQGIKLVINTDWASSSELTSLAIAVEELGNDTILLYGDLLFRTYILNNLLDWDAPLLAVVDSSPLDQAQGNTNDLAYCNTADNRAMYQQKVLLEQISPDMGWNGRVPNGRWIGVLRISGEGRNQVISALQALQADSGFSQMGLPQLINQLIAQSHAPQVQYIAGHWMDLNNLDDLQRAGAFAQGHRS